MRPTRSLSADRTPFLKALRRRRPEIAGDRSLIPAASNSLVRRPPQSTDIRDSAAQSQLIPTWGAGHSNVGGRIRSEPADPVSTRSLGLALQRTQSISIVS